ncbi:MAG: VWA domain-containing protein [Prevotellamassilia sp.]|jgi:batA protein|nr:VWA domain-containing protein [Prevotellamassilia sp.]
MTFANPAYFLLLLLLIPWIVWYFLFRSKSESHIQWASTEALRRVPHTWRTRLVHLPFFLRTVLYVLAVIILARPQTGSSWRTGQTEGIDIMMALDISTSMATPDISPNRITAARDVALDFINNRPNDNIGLTLFGGEAFTQCPLTTDHATLMQSFKGANCNLQNDGIIQPGTAIGMGIASAVSHLENSPSKSKVVILLTDGANNTGEISPLMATDMAKNLGIRIYTILLGSNSKVNVPVAQLPNGEVYTQQVDDTTDPSTLKQIANETGGIFYHASSRSSLKQVYDDIDKLEKTKLKVSQHSRHYEAYQPFALAAILVLLLEILLRTTWFKRL